MTRLNDYTSFAFFQVSDFSVSLKAPGRNKHFRVHVEGNMYCIGQRKFPSLNQLVDHYQVKIDREIIIPSILCVNSSTSSVSPELLNLLACLWLLRKLACQIEFIFIESKVIHIPQ